MQVGPPEPLMHTSVAGERVHLAPAVEQRPLRGRVALDHDDHARPHGEDVAALGRRAPPPARARGRRRARRAARTARRGAGAGRRRRGRRRPARPPRAGAGTRPGRSRRGRRRRAPRRRRARSGGGRRPRSCAASGRCRRRPAAARRCRRRRRSPAPRAGRGWGCHAPGPVGEGGLLALAVGLARPQGDHAAVGDESGVIGVDEVGARGLGLELTDGDAEAGQDRAEGVVLALGLGQVDAGAGTRTPGPRGPLPNAAPGRLTSTSRSGAVMLWAPKRRVLGAAMSAMRLA